MKLFYFLHAIFYGFLIYLGFSYLKLDAALWAEFIEVGWNNYEGPSLSSPENSYYLIGLLASFFTVFVVWGKRLIKNGDAIAISGLIFSTIAVIVYAGLYFLDGDASIKESQLVWIFISVIQILISGVAIFDTILAEMVKTSLKQLFLLNGILYLTLCGLGFYFLNWDNTILVEKERLGALYQGTDKDFPENTYHFILAVLNLISLILGMLVKDKKNISRIYKGILGVFFLYSLFVALNDGNPDMAETQSWWVSLTVLTSLISFVLFILIENKLPEQEEETFYDDNILDDLSSLE